MAGNEHNANGRWNNSSSTNRLLLNDINFKTGERNGDVGGFGTGNEPSLGSSSQSSLISQEPGSFGKPSQKMQNQQMDTEILEAANSQRKRSRVGEGNDETEQRYKIEELLKKLQNVTEQIAKKSEKGKNIVEKANLTDLFKDLCMSYVSCLSYATDVSSKLLSSQEEKERLLNKIEGAFEEKTALQQQIIELQLQLAQRTTTSSSSSLQNSSYLQAAMKNTATAIATKKHLPIPVIPESVLHAPSEHILLFRDKEKGAQKTKKEQEIFRQEIRDAVGEELAKQIIVIRPTRYGGYTLIFQNEETRDAALKCFRQNEMLSNIDVKSSCIIAPKKKLAKVVCREPPLDLTPDQLIIDFYSLKNPQLHLIPPYQREARIITSSTIGWIFEVSSEEAAACYMQGGKIRYGYGREMKVEEFIPLQQCYKCCAFGHNANECMSNMAFCRLCGAAGHAGKDCLKKDNKEAWRCINCKITNEAKGYNLPLDHGAAQLHKCPCALNQKMIKKEQLAAAGVFTTPILKETSIQKMERQTNTSKERSTSGTQMSGEQKRTNSRARKNRSNSKKRNNILEEQIPRTQNTASTVSVNFSSSSSSQPSLIDFPNNMEKSSNQTGEKIRSFHITRPRSTDGWKSVRNIRDNMGSETRGRGDEEKVGGTNSTSNLMFIENRNDDTHMQ